MEMPKVLLHSRLFPVVDTKEDKNQTSPFIGVGFTSIRGSAIAHDCLAFYSYERLPIAWILRKRWSGEHLHLRKLVDLLVMIRLLPEPN